MGGWNVPRTRAHPHADRFSSLLCSFVTDLIPANIQLSHKHMLLVTRGTGWDIMARLTQVHHPQWETAQTTWLGGLEPPKASAWTKAAASLLTKRGLPEHFPSLYVRANVFVPFHCSCNGFCIILGIIKKWAKSIYHSKLHNTKAIHQRAREVKMQVFQ